MFDRQSAKFFGEMFDSWEKWKEEKSGRIGRKAIGNPTTNLPYGPNGIFGLCGTDQQVISAHVTPRGLDPFLMVKPTVEVNPLFANFTGIQADGDDEPSTGCTNCPGGLMKSCYTTATTGRICRESQTIEINDVMKRTNRGQFDDLVLLGDMLGPSNFQAVPESTDVLQTATEAQMAVVGVLHQRALAKMLWQGNPANNVGTGYMEFPGLDMLINTGKVDAQTGVACPSMDSDVKNFNYNMVDSNAVDIVLYLSWLEYYCYHNADRMGLAPARWVVCMRPELWEELSAIWPCRYLTNRCTTSTGTNPMVINDDVNAKYRDAMREGMFIDINGRRYDVVVDDGIYESNSTNDANLNPGQFASDIYFVPLTILNRVPVTYWEHIDFRAATGDNAFLRGNNLWWWSDDGRFFWVVEQQSYCFLLRAKVEPRLVLRAPHLAGRLQNVAYEPLQHLRSPFDDDAYFVDGGRYSRSAQSWYSEWNLPVQ